MDKTLCFTGHRPHKLIYGFDEQHDMCVRLKSRIKIEIEQKITAMGETSQYSEKDIVEFGKKNGGFLY